MQREMYVNTEVFIRSRISEESRELCKLSPKRLSVVWTEVVGHVHELYSVGAPGGCPWLERQP